MMFLDTSLDMSYRLAHRCHMPQLAEKISVLKQVQIFHDGFEFRMTII